MNVNNYTYVAVDPGPAYRLVVLSTAHSLLGDLPATARSLDIYRAFGQGPFFVQLRYEGMWSGGETLRVARLPTLEYFALLGAYLRKED